MFYIDTSQAHTAHLSAARSELWGRSKRQTRGLGTPRQPWNSEQRRAIVICSAPRVRPATQRHMLNLADSSAYNTLVLCPIRALGQE